MSENTGERIQYVPIMGLLNPIETPVVNANANRNRFTFTQLLFTLMTLCSGSCGGETSSVESIPLISGDVESGNSGHNASPSDGVRAPPPSDGVRAPPRLAFREAPAPAPTHPRLTNGFKALLKRTFPGCFDPEVAVEPEPVAVEPEPVAAGVEWRYFVEVTHESLRWLLEMILLLVPASYFKSQEAAAAPSANSPSPSPSPSSSLKQTKFVKLLGLVKSNYSWLFLPTITVYIIFYLASFCFRGRRFMMFLQVLSILAGIAMVSQAVVFAGADPTSYLAGVVTTLGICLGVLIVFKMVDCRIN